MLYRDYKEFAPGGYYHIFNRGNGKQDIFLDKQDFHFFLLRLRENLFPQQTNKQDKQGSPLLRRKVLPPNLFTLVCYCLMPNHFHFLIRQNTDLPISKLISKICTSHSMYFNKKYKRVGHVFQGKFKAVSIETDEQLLWVSAYIHQNPKVAKLVDQLEDYPWSSYLEYTGMAEKGICEKEIILKRFRGIGEYEDYVRSCFELIKDRKEAERLAIDSNEL